MRISMLCPLLLPLASFCSPASAMLTADDFERVARRVIERAFAPIALAINLPIGQGVSGALWRSSASGQLETANQGTFFEKLRDLVFHQTKDIPLAKTIEMTESDIETILNRLLLAYTLPLMNALSITAEGQPKAADFEGAMITTSTAATPPVTPQPGVAAPHRGVAAPQPGLGAPQPGLGAPQPGLGAPQPGLGAPQPGLGAPQPGLGAPQPGLGVQQPVLAAPQPGVPGPQPGIAASQPGVTLPQRTVFSVRPHASVPGVASTLRFLEQGRHRNSRAVHRRKH